MPRATRFPCRVALPPLPSPVPATFRLRLRLHLHLHRLRGEGTPEEFGTILKRDYAKYGKILTGAGIKPE
jgi:hypothetical protein